MVTMARSKNLAGPYESNPANPVLTNANTTQWCKSVSLRPFYVMLIYHEQSKPLATLISCRTLVVTGTYQKEDKGTDSSSDTNRWCVALSVRSGPKNLNWPMGRETVLTNVTWTNGSWPVFQPVRGEIQAPLPPEVHQDKIPGEG